MLAPSVERCLTSAGATPADLAAVVAGVGPGPFTGLRVGLMTATAMADALGVPAYGVCSLDAIAWGLARPGPLLVATDARRRAVDWAEYADGVRTQGPAVDRPADVSVPIGQPMAGAGARLYRTALTGAGSPEAELLDCDHPPLTALVALAAERIRAGAPGEALTPLYLRRPDAVPPAGLAVVAGPAGR